MTSPATVEQPPPTPPPRLVHCICRFCNPDVCFPLLRPTTALCGHVVSVDASHWSGTEPTCLVCDDLESTHNCWEHR